MKKEDIEEFDIDYTDKKHSTTKYIIIIGIIIVAVLVIFNSSKIEKIFNNAEINIVNIFNQSDNKQIASNTNIYDINEVLKDQNVAKDAQYVKAKRDFILYLNIEKAVVIYSNPKSKDGKYNFTVIYVDTIIDKNGKSTPIEDCYNSKAKINKNLDSCLLEKTNYIISEPDHAIVEETYFMKELY